MKARDLYVKIINKDGSSHIEHHFVWDAERFLASLREQHKEEGNTVMMASEAEYRAYKWPKR